MILFAVTCMNCWELESCLALIPISDDPAMADHGMKH